MFATSMASLESRVLSVATAALLAAMLTSCSSESEPVVAQSAQANAEAASSGDPAEAAADDDRDIRHPQLLEGIPVIDGDYTRAGAGSLTNGSTAYERFNVATGQSWQDAAAAVREQLTAAGFTEQSWADYADARYDVRAQGLFEQGDRVVVVEVEKDGRVAYSVHEMPAGSYAEQNFACDSLRKFGARAALLPMMTAAQGGTVTAEQVDFGHAFVAGMAGRLPTDVRNADQALYDAVVATIGQDFKAVAPGSDLATAVKSAKAASSAATDAYCKG